MSKHCRKKIHSIINVEKILENSYEFTEIFYKFEGYF